MNAAAFFKQLLLIVWGSVLLLPSLIVAGPVTQQEYYSIQLLSGKPKKIRKAWEKMQQMSYARIEKHAGVYTLRIGYWKDKQPALDQLAQMTQNFPAAFILHGEFEPDKIIQKWTTDASETIIDDAAAAGEGAGRLPSNLLARQEYSQPEIFVFNKRHEIWLEKPPIKPAKKPLVPSRPVVVVEPAKKRKKMPDERPLWRLYGNKKYDVLQAELIRLRAIYPNWRPPQNLLALLLQEKIADKIHRAIQQKDTVKLTFLAQLYPDVFTCAHIDWAWALAEARASLQQTSALIFGLHQLIPDCDEQDRLATLYKAREWLDDDQWELLLERELQAQRTPQGDTEFQKLYYQHQTKKLLSAYQDSDTKTFQALFLQLADRIEYYQDVGTALLGGWYYYNNQQNDAAEKWFLKALAWDPQQRDAVRGLSLNAQRDSRFTIDRYYTRIFPADGPVRPQALRSDVENSEFLESAARPSIALAGGELNPGNSYAYVGVILPLATRLGNNFVQRYWADRLTYSFDQNDRRVDAEQWGAEALFGYRKFYQQGWWAAFVGPVYRHIQFAPNIANISNRGDAFHAKIQFEGEQILSDNWRVNGIASYVTGQNNYWVRGRLLHTANKKFSVGPEVITLGDTNFQIFQFGWAILAAEVLPKTDIGIKFGVRSAHERPTTGYLGIELGRSF